MGQRTSKQNGLATKAEDFDDALISHLGELLDVEDETPFQLDWRTLTERLGLKKDENKPLLDVHAAKKTKVIVKLWSYQQPENSNGRELVRVLLDMGRRDAALAVQSHLGERYDPGRSELEDQFQEVDTAARFGQLEEVKKLIGNKMGPEVEEVFQACPSILWSPLHTSAQYGHLPVVKFLVERNFSIYTKNHQDKTPRQVAVEKSQKRAAAYLEKAEAAKVPSGSFRLSAAETGLASLLGQILTVYSTDERQLPVDIPIESEQLDDVIAAASAQLDVQVECLVNANTRARVTSINDFFHVRQVLAVPVNATDDEAKNISIPAVVPVIQIPTRVVRGPRRVLLYALRQFWQQPPQILEFEHDEEFSLILQRASEKLGCEVVQLLTCDKLSRIPSSNVLAHKPRAIGLDAPSGRMAPDERKALVTVQFIGEPVEKEFTRAGGTLFSPVHGVLVTLPEGAIRGDDRVTLRIKVALPARQMDLGDEATAYRPVGHPVLIESIPPKYQFRETTSLRFPHCGAIEENVNAPISVFSASDFGGQEITFRKIADQLVKVQANYLSVLLSQFSWFWAFAPRTVSSRQYTVSVFSPKDEVAKGTEPIPFKAFIYPALHVYYEGAVQLVRGDADSQDWILRGQQTFVSLPLRQIDVTSDSSDPMWKLSPPSQAFELQDAWDVLYDSDKPTDHFILRVKATRPEKKQDTLLSFKLTLAARERPAVLNLYVDLPSFGPGSEFLLSPQLKEELSRLLDGARERGWRELAVRLGMNPREMEGKESPTLSILMRFEWRHGTLSELQDALYYLAWRT